MHGRGDLSPLRTVDDNTFGQPILARHLQRLRMLQLREELSTLGEQSATAGEEIISPSGANGGAQPSFGYHFSPTTDFGLLRQNHFSACQIVV
jgi:hypothetical protein